MSEAKTVVPFEASSPDPAGPAKAQRRKFSAEDKKRILEESDRRLCGKLKPTARSVKTPPS